MKRIAAVALLIVATTIAIKGQAPLTLLDAQAEARAHAPDVGELDALVRGAEAFAAQARRRVRQNPDVSASYGPGALVGRSDEVTWTIGAALPVDLSGSWKPRTASADADVARARSEEHTSEL